MLPERFLQRMEVQLGEEYEDFLKSLERPRAVALRFNPLKGDAPALPFVMDPVPWEPEAVFSAPAAVSLPRAVRNPFPFSCSGQSCG